MLSLDHAASQLAILLLCFHARHTVSQSNAMNPMCRAASVVAADQDQQN